MIGTVNLAESKKTRIVGIAALPKQASSVPDFYENDIVHVELRADSRPVFAGGVG
jgi:hypothetical protein